jgi:serine/threonine protein kinase
LPSFLIVCIVERIVLEHIESPFIVKLHFAFQTPERLYFVMDFLNGGEMFYHLRKEGCFSEERTRFYAAEIILALEVLHKNGVIYRDLKPENVLLDSDGHLKLTDFGLCKLQQNATKMTYTYCGTPEYLAPEIIQGTGHNELADWWSLVSFTLKNLCRAL